MTAKFEIFHIALDFTAKEQAEYDGYSVRIARLLARLCRLYPFFSKTKEGSSGIELSLLARRSDRIGDVARSLVTQYQKRKELVHTADSKVNCGVLIANLLLPKHRTILFAERIRTANELYAQLSKQYPSRISLYHSEMDPALKARALDRYRSGESLAIICCRYNKTNRRKLTLQN